MATQKRTGGGRGRGGGRSGGRTADAAFFTEVMTLAAASGWRRLGWAEIAEATGWSLSELHDRFGSKQGLLDAFVDLVDGIVLAGPPADPADTPKDRLFDVLMRRFDALAPYRDGLGAIVRDAGLGAGGPGAALCGLGRTLRSMGWMLEAAGLSAVGIAGGMRMNGLAAVYAATFLVWLRDDTEDMSRTMAALDRNLDRAGRLAGLGGRRRRPDPYSGATGGEASEAASRP